MCIKNKLLKEVWPQYNISQRIAKAGKIIGIKFTFYVKIV